LLIEDFTSLSRNTGVILNLIIKKEIKPNTRIEIKPKSPINSIIIDLISYPKTPP
jgi:hypothetical protein